MFKLDITTNVLFAIIILSTLLLLLITLLFIAFMYHTKRKYDSLNIYIKSVADKINTYKENLKHYNKCLYDSGIKSKSISKIFKTVISKIGGSK